MNAWSLTVEFFSYFLYINADTGSRKRLFSTSLTVFSKFGGSLAREDWKPVAYFAIRQVEDKP